MKTNRIQSLLNSYLERFGSISLLLPDGVGLEIGITQQTKHGDIKQHDYCWVVAKKDDRSTMLDKYSMSMSFDEVENHIVDSSEYGSVFVI